MVSLSGIIMWELQAGTRNIMGLVYVIYDSRRFECSHLGGKRMHSINDHIMQECMKLGILREHALAVQVNT